MNCIDAANDPAIFRTQCAVSCIPISSVCFVTELKILPENPFWKVKVRRYLTFGLFAPI